MRRSAARAGRPSRRGRSARRSPPSTTSALARKASDDEVERAGVVLQDAVVDRRLGQRRRARATAAVPTISARNISATRAAVGAQQHDAGRAACARGRRCRRRRRRRSSRRVGGAARPSSPGRHSPATSRSSGLRVRKTWSGSPFSTISRYSSRLLEQLVVLPCGGDRAVLEHDDLVGQRDRRQAVGDDERRAARHHLAQRELDLLLGRGVDRRGRVVEDQDARVGQQRARDRDALALAAATASGRARRRACRSRRAARAMKSCACARRGGASISSRVASGARVGDVVGDRGGEQERVVVDDRDRAAQRGRRRRRARRRRRSARRPRVDVVEARRAAARATSCPSRSRRRARPCVPGRDVRSTSCSAGRAAPS